MKTPDEIKKGLDHCGDITDLDHSCTGCPYNLANAPCDCECGLERDALAYIQQLETTYSQVSKALCGKENATLEELLQAVDQLKAPDPYKTFSEFKRGSDDY